MNGTVFFFARPPSTADTHTHIHINIYIHMAIYPTIHFHHPHVSGPGFCILPFAYCVYLDRPTTIPRQGMVAPSRGG